MRSEDLLKSIKDPALISGRLHIPDLVKARATEIKHLENALSSSNSKSRAFQTLPRRLRRRTASHNPKRVPKKYRKRAEAECAKDNAQPLKKRRVDEFIPSEEAPKRYSNRQKEKIWLPTHIWHKKRAKIAEKYGYMVPQTPTQKQYRLTHRLREQLAGTLIWDTSFFETVLIKKDRNEICTIVKDHFPGLEKPIYTSGKVSWQGLFSNGRVCGPAICFYIQSGLVINCHPALMSDLGDLFPDLEVNNFGSIDLLGGKALHTLTACVVLGEASTSKQSLWRQLGGLASIDSLPYNAILHLNMYDPRLYFPPSRQRKNVLHETLVSTLSDWPAPECDPPLFGELTCEKMQTTSEINKKKVAGKHVGATKDDVQVPITLLKLQGGRLRLLLPWKWVLPLWLSLVHMPNVFFGGERESEQVAFEQNTPHFPRDYPHTRAGAEMAAQTQAQLARSHASKPTSVRKCYKDEIGDPFSCDFGLEKPLEHVTVKYCHRGAPKDFARIYSIPDEHRQAWEATKYKTEMDEYPECPPPEFLIGYVTSGSFNLAHGFGTAIGRAACTEGLCLVRNVGEKYARLAELKPCTDVHV